MSQHEHDSNDNSPTDSRDGHGSASDRNEQGGGRAGAAAASRVTHPQQPGLEELVAPEADLVRGTVVPGDAMPREAVPAESVLGEWELLGAPWAEAAVLGCLLRATPVIARALLDALGEQDWTVPQHRHVAAAARILLERGQPVDPVTVLGQLRRHGSENARTASKDTAVLLLELCEAAPVLGNAEHYARIVLEHSYRRRVQQAAVRLAQAADHLPLHTIAPLLEQERSAVTAAHRRTTAPLDLRNAHP
ncbi:DnaB-like helicase N-terminal domain-containing protein [Vallicoccus soli]|uniref:DNA helicase DnaB-like N-terminal domain-containing protein n=1 Tax=Vallicoccus soli TaxID=2339232 RepID=A0A3A3YPA9_9ACTN|nr:DnaB-like helicase N-terminal domain-containing protein [Vallicoccus soli]RJK92527.1 hypothetical protein D5H78_18800 [Vallicoccus soli]